MHFLLAGANVYLRATIFVVAPSDTGPDLCAASDNPERSMAVAARKQPTMPIRATMLLRPSFRRSICSILGIPAPGIAYL